MIVPTVERVVRTLLACSMAIAGGMPSMRSAFGLSMRSMNCRVYGLNVSHVPPLPFGIQRVEGEAGFSAAAWTRYDDELPKRQIEIDTLKIILARAEDADERRHARYLTPKTQAGAPSFSKFSVFFRLSVCMRTRWRITLPDLNLTVARAGIDIIGFRLVGIAAHPGLG